MATQRVWQVYTAAAYLVSTGYLGATASPNLFYLSNVLIHLTGGVLLCALAAAAWSGWWRSQDSVGRLLLVLLAVGFATGAALAFTGATRPYRWLLVSHIAASSAGTFGLLLWPSSRRRLATALAVPPMAFRALQLSAHALWLLPLLWLTVHRAQREANRIDNPVEAPLTMKEETAMPEGPFFPSAAETAHGGTIPARFFLESKTCGTAGCHPDILQQWESSVHRRASFNNQWYRKSIEYMQDVAGVQASKWCGGCHDHAVLFSGMMDRPIREIVDGPEANAGLACVSCHSIVRVKNTMGNGGFVIEYPPLHDLATSDHPVVRTVHNYVTRLDPGPHRESFLKPFHREQNPEFCSSCHKVHLDVPVNSYRWMRGFNEYDPWQGSGVSGQGARAFYYPEAFKTCNDCHMPLVPSRDAGHRGGLVHSHRFAAANAALPVAYGDGPQLEAVRQNLENRLVSVDIFAIGRGPADTPHADLLGVDLPDPLQVSTSFPEAEELGVLVGRGARAVPDFEMTGPLDAADVAVRPGESVRIDVVVRTLGLGHFFPGGTVDAFDAWVELQARDEQGRVVFWSGSVADDGRGPVDPGSHFYRSLLLDANGNPINKRNAWAARSLMYVRLIPPGAADTVHYRVEVPEDATGRLQLRARVLYRKFAWWNTQWSYAGVRDPRDTLFALSPHYDDGRWIFAGDTSTVSGPLKAIPNLPAVTMAEAAASLRIASANGDPPVRQSVLRKEDLIRWNDYGIGLLLQGDLRGAERAFQAVAQIDPGYADGWVNLARVQVQQGAAQEALDLLEKAFTLQPELGKAHYFAGLALKSQGRYEDALGHFRRALHRFPRDKVVRSQAGRVLFLMRRFQEAVAEFHAALRVDPEDIQAHYNLMLCYQGLGQPEKAERERALYLRYKASEASQAITGDYRRIHPQDNLERQQIHEHRSTLTGQAAGVTANGGSPR